MRSLRSMNDAPPNKPVLVRISDADMAKTDGMHGPWRLAANRGHGWVTIPGLWPCHPVGWFPLPEEKSNA